MGEHRKKYEKRNLQLKKFRAIIIISLIAIILVLIFEVLARYASNNFSDFFFESKEFYFYSDKLTTDGANYQIDNWSGVEEYNIVINMNSMKNNLKKANYDIGYEISYTASDNIICQISKTEGIISSQTNTDSFNLKITPNAVFQNGDNAWVDINVKSTGEYEKELKATFKLVVGQENVTYAIDDEKDSPYFELNITNNKSYYTVREAFDGYRVGDRININDYLNLSDENKSKCYSAEITLNFDPKEVVIDSTDKTYLHAKNVDYTNLNGYNYVNKITFEVESLSSENVRFYKMDNSKDYTYPIINDKSIIDVEIK